MKPSIIHSSIYEFAGLIIWLAIVLGLLIYISGCAAAIQRPDANIYGVNAGKDQMQGNNILHDYDSAGNRTAPGLTQFKDASVLKDINGWICTDPKGFSAIKTSIADARNYINHHCTCK